MRNPRSIGLEIVEKMAASYQNFDDYLLEVLIRNSVNLETGYAKAGFNLGNLIKFFMDDKWSAETARQMAEAYVDNLVLNAPSNGWRIDVQGETYTISAQVFNPRKKEKKA